MRWFAIVAGTTALVVLCVPVTASGSCLQTTERQLEKQADVIFEGVALEGPTSSGVQRFRVVRYLKGGGSGAEAVATGATPNLYISEGIRPAKGELWRILGSRNHGTGFVATGDCAGSGKIAFAPLQPVDNPPSTGDGGNAMARVAVVLAVLGLGGLAAALVARRWFRRSPA